MSTSTVILMLVLGHVYFGSGFVVGGPQYMSSPSFDVAKLWATEPVWGWLFIAGAGLTLAAPHVPWWSVAAVLHLLAAAPLLAMSVALLANIANATGWGGPVLYLMPVLAHGWILRGRYLRAVELRTNPEVPS